MCVFNSTCKSYSNFKVIFYILELDIHLLYHTSSTELLPFTLLPNSYSVDLKLNSCNDESLIQVTNSAILTTFWIFFIFFLK